MGDYLIEAGFSAKHCGLHVPMEREDRYKGKSQRNGLVNSAVMRYMAGEIDEDEWRRLEQPFWDLIKAGP